MVNTLVSITFDDGYEITIRNVIPILREYNIRATFFIIASKVGEIFENFKIADWSIWKDLACQGMEIGSHSLTHTTPSEPLSRKFIRILSLIKYSEPREQINIIRNEVTRSIRRVREFVDIYSEIIKSKSIIERNIGTKVYSYSYPGGIVSSSLKEALRNAGYILARSSTRGYNVWNRIDLYELKSMVWTKYTTASIANRWVDEAVKKGAWLIETLHIVLSLQGNTKPIRNIYVSSIEELIKHLDYIKSIGIPTVTLVEGAKIISAS